MMPLQVLGKLASDTAFKTRACERMIDLESNDGVVQLRLRSLMTDMGTEASLWLVPNFNQPHEKLFPFILPIADLDHGLHHCMLETVLGYDEVLWHTYEKQVSALAKLFSRRDVVNRFVKFQILDHPDIPAAAKESLASMFDKLCPSFVKHRWKYSFEVLHWLSSPQGFFKYLQPNILKSDHDSDMTRDECDAFKQLLSDDMQSARFWAMAHSELVLHTWGFEVSEWLHACPCHSKVERKKMKPPCVWNGRRLIEVSGGKMSAFHTNLLSLRLESNSSASKSISDLREKDSETASKIAIGFATAKQKVALRFKQATSYLETYPWNLVNVLSFLCAPSDVNCFKTSKAFASSLVQQYDAGLLRNIGQFSRFLDSANSLGQSMREWSSSDSPIMNAELYQELLGYGTALLCMQRLEAKHHLVAQRMSTARGSTPATISANLRRALNSDVHSDDFRENFPRYMFEFKKLVDLPWQSRAELARLISGYHLHTMFANVSAEQALIAQVTHERNAGAQANVQCLRDQVAHMKTMLAEGDFYAMPVAVAPNGDTTYNVLQLLSLQPSLKKYMQRVLKIDDPWHQKLSVMLLGQVAVRDNTSDIMLVDNDSPLPLTMTEDFSFESVCYGQVELDPSIFFKFDFKHVYRFDTVDFTTSFVGLSDLEVDDSETALVDLKLQKHCYI